MGFSRQEYWSGLPLPSLKFFSYLCAKLLWGPVLDKKANFMVPLPPSATIPLSPLTQAECATIRTSLWVLYWILCLERGRGELFGLQYLCYKFSFWYWMLFTKEEKQYTMSQVPANKDKYFFPFLFFWGVGGNRGCAALLTGILVPWPEIKPGPLAVRVP